MTKTEYINAGYKLSLQVEDAEIARAEADVVAAYITPITGGGAEFENAAKQAVMALAFFILCKRKAWATRAGGSLKATAQSQRTDEQTEQYEMAKTCHLYLDALRRTAGVPHPDAEVLDVCGIYYKTNFISL